MVDLFGHKTAAVFDFWSIAHFLTGCGLAYPLSTLAKRIQLGARDSVLIVLLLSSTWEVLELYLELGTLGGAPVKYWFQGVEHPLNRIFSDQILLLFGYALARGRMKLSIMAKSIAMFWLAINVFLFPHSMYIQETWSLAFAS